MTDIDPLSRTGLIAGMIIALFIGAPETYDAYTEQIRMDTTRQELELSVERPEHPDIQKIRKYFCPYGEGAYRTPLPICDGDRIAVLVDAGRAYRIRPSFLAAMALLESTGGLHACGWNFWGYASCAVRFESFDEAVHRVAKTLAGYVGTERDAASVWRTGGRGDDSGYPEKLLRIADDIDGF